MYCSSILEEKDQEEWGIFVGNIYIPVLKRNIDASQNQNLFFQKNIYNIINRNFKSVF